MTSFLYKAPAGFAGDISRPDDAIVEPIMFAASDYPTAFGQPIKLSGGKAVLMGLTSVAADFYGIVVREVPSIGDATKEAFNDGVPNPKVPHGILRRGYALVQCGVGTPARGGAVYVRIVDGGAGKPVGQFEATADGVNNVPLTGVTWAADGVDANFSPNNIAEIYVLR